MILKKIYDFASLLSRWPKFYIRNNKISWSSRIGKNTFLKGCQVSHHVFVGQNCCITSAEIGSYSCVSWNAMIGGMEHDYNYYSINPLLNRSLDTIPRQKTIIGNDVWIGANVVIRQGVKIGNGAVIGAGSVVTHDIPPYTIAYGIPARIIKNRFNNEIIKRIEKSKYWCYNEKVAKRIISEMGQ